MLYSQGFHSRYSASPGVPTPPKGVGHPLAGIIMFGDKFSKRRVNEDAANGQLSVFRKAPLTAAAPKKTKEGSGAGDAIAVAGDIAEKAPAVVAGAKTGMTLAAKAAPIVAGIPVVGPALAVAAPTIGTVVGGTYGALTGGKGIKAAKGMPKNLKSLREEGAKHFDFSQVGKYFSG